MVDKEFLPVSLLFCLVTGSTAVAQQDAVRAAAESETEVASACLERLTEAQTRAGDASLPEDLQRELAQLSESARLLAEKGQSEACDTVVTTMQEMSDRAAAEQERDRTRKVLENAPLLRDQEHGVKASAMVGTGVRNLLNEELGTIEEAVISPDTAEIAYLVLAFGGILGVGEKLIPIPFEELRIARSTEDDEVFYVLPASAEYLNQRQELDPGEEWPTQLPGTWDAAAAKAANRPEV